VQQQKKLIIAQTRPKKNFQNFEAPSKKKLVKVTRASAGYTVCQCRISGLGPWKLVGYNISLSLFASHCDESILSIVVGDRKSFQVHPTVSANFVIITIFSNLKTHLKN